MLLLSPSSSKPWSIRSTWCFDSFHAATADGELSLQLWEAARWMTKQSMPLQELCNAKQSSRCCRRMATLIQNLGSFEHSVYPYDPGVGKAFRSSGVCNWAIPVVSQSLAQEIVSSGRRKKFAGMIPGVNLACALVVTWSTWLWWNPLLFDQQPWRWCGCAKVLVEDGWNFCRLGRQKEPSTLFPWKTCWLQWLLRKASRRSQLWLLGALGEKLWQQYPCRKTPCLWNLLGGKTPISQRFLCLKAHSPEAQAYVFCEHIVWFTLLKLVLTTNVNRSLWWLKPFLLATCHRNISNSGLKLREACSLRWLEHQKPTILWHFMWMYIYIYIWK